MDREEQLSRQRDQQAEGQALGSAQQVASKKLQQRVENPEFFQQLRDPDLADEDSEYAWLENELAPAFSGTHVIGNRSPEHEQRIEWSMQAQAQRVVSERSSGRLCKGTTHRIAKGLHRRDDKRQKPEFTSDERRAVRDAFEAAKAERSLSVEARGFRGVTEATAVSKVEKQESESSSRLEQAGSFLGGGE